MEIKQFLEESFVIVLYSIYPLFILYANFIFFGIFILGPNTFPEATILVLFVIFNFLLTLAILYYVLLSTTEGKSTQDIFPLVSKSKLHRNFESINPFIADTLLEKSIEKTHTCTICQTYKPPRCHHCKRCNRCYLKFDHHCVFIDTCVGFHNYKFFIQFLVANFFLVLYYVVILCIEFGIEGDHSTQVVTNVVVSTTLGCLILFVNIQTLILHLRLLPNNETIVEYYAINSYLEGDHTHIDVFQEGPIIEFSNSKDRKVLNPYNLGANENLREVFGNTPWEWISPSLTSISDGVSFKKNFTNESDMFVRLSD